MKSSDEYSFELLGLPAYYAFTAYHYHQTKSIVFSFEEIFWNRGGEQNQNSFDTNEVQ